MTLLYRVIVTKASPEWSARRAYNRGVSTRKPWDVAIVVLLVVFAVVVFVLLSAAVGVPSEISLPLLVLAAIAFRAFRNRRGHVAG